MYQWTARALVALFLMCGVIGCAAKPDTTPVRESIDSFLIACSNGDAIRATSFLAETKEQAGYSEKNSEDTTGLLWARLPGKVQARMQGNTNAKIEVWRYVGNGLKNMFLESNIESIEYTNEAQSEALVVVTGTGRIIDWMSADAIYDKIAEETEKEFKSDYDYYKDKIETEGQDTVFVDLRNKAATKVFKELISELSKMEDVNYKDEINVIKASDDSWEISKITRSKLLEDSADGDN